MEEGVKIVVGIMVALIIAFGVIYVFAERLLGTDENILKPTEKESGNTISIQMCKALHGNKSFLVTSNNNDSNCIASDCEDKNYIFGVSNGECTEVIDPPNNDKCCCKCRNS